jgi:hypothetical protein
VEQVTIAFRSPYQDIKERVKDEYL